MTFAAQSQPAPLPIAEPIDPADLAARLEWLYGLGRFGIKLGLEATARALAALGHPERAYPTLHVAGTNGKGSTCAFAAAMLAELGLGSRASTGDGRAAIGAGPVAIGLYTSPHLARFNERVAILSGRDRRLIADEEVVRLADRVRVKSGTELTFFEATTVMAFAHFAAAAIDPGRPPGPVDLAVLETGMGGRLDATNLCQPEATAITNVSLEHQAYLGHTVRAIAGEKAGIIKPGVPVATTAQDPEVLSVIAERARACQSPLYVFGRDFHAELDQGGFHYDGPGGPLHAPGLGLDGDHQIKNAALALALIGLSPSARALAAQRGADFDRARSGGLLRVEWPGRFERLALGQGRPQVILDAAHNPAAAQALGRTLKAERAKTQGAERRHGGGRHGRLRLVFGVLDDKDVGAMLAELLPLADEVVLCEPRTPRGRKPQTYLDAAPGATVAPSVTAALAGLLAHCTAEDTILVAGSCYLLGEARAALVALREAP